MGELIGIVMAVVVCASLAAIGFYVLFLGAVSASTLVRSRQERRLADELDQVLLEVLGPRTTVDCSRYDVTSPSHDA
jgi:hypothetical protein